MSQAITRPSFLIPTFALLIVLSLPPFGVSIFYWIGLSLFIITISDNALFKKNYIFLFFFLIQFVSLSWIIQSFASGGTYYLFLGIFLIFLLASFIALLNFLLIKIILIYFFNTHLKYILLPLSLSIVEILKEFILGGFPWNPSAIIYSKNLWVLSTLPYMGVYGLGVLIHLFVGLLSYALKKRIKILAIFIISGASLLYLLSFIDKQETNNNAEKSLNMVLIQPNIYESLVQFDVLKNLQAYEDLTNQALSAHPNTDVIIWPEGSLPIDLNNRPGLLSRVGGLLNKNQIIILGSSAIEDNQLYNRLFVIDHQGTIVQHYDKQKLVLFGEYVPFVKPLLSRFLNLGMNYSPGKEETILQLPNDIKAVPMICFESIFHYLHINSKICPIDLVIQISNDSWFGKWYGPYQHLANSLLRSVEFKKTLIRSTPSGTSAIINSDGSILKSIPNNEKNYLYYQHPVKEFLEDCRSNLIYVALLLLLFFCGSFLFVRIKK